MGCTYTSGESLNCADFNGGVKAVYFGHLSDFTSGVTVASGEITALPTATVYEWDFRNETVLFEQTIQSEGGRVTFEQTLTIPVEAIVTEAGDATRIELLDSVIRERNVIFVLDNNDSIYMMGRVNGTNTANGTVSTGTSLGDFNGYNLTFVAREKFQAEVLDQYTSTVFDNFAGITVS